MSLDLEELERISKRLEEPFLSINSEIIDICYDDFIADPHFRLGGDFFLPKTLFSHLVEKCFIASLENDEGRQFPFTVIVCSKSSLEELHCSMFSTRIELTARSLSKISPACISTVKSIVVTISDGSAYIVGTCKSYDKVLTDKLELRSLRPGSVWVSTALHTIGYFTKSRSFVIPSWSRHHEFLLKGFGVCDDDEDIVIGSPVWLEKMRLANEILRRMIGYQRGGILIFSPEENWRLSISSPIHFEYADPRKGHFNEINCHDDLSEHGNIVNDIAAMSRVDGAVVLDQDFAPLAFGAKIRAVNSEDTPKEIYITDPSWIKRSELSKANIETIGGMRHRSCAQFVYDRRRSTAFAVSQDGPVTAFAWNMMKNSVVAIRHYEAGWSC